jgi:hypothetical protein
VYFGELVLELRHAHFQGFLTFGFIGHEDSSFQSEIFLIESPYSEKFLRGSLRVLRIPLCSSRIDLIRCGELDAIRMENWIESGRSREMQVLINGAYPSDSRTVEFWHCHCRLSSKYEESTNAESQPSRRDCSGLNAQWIETGDSLETRPHSF